MLKVFSSYTLSIVVLLGILFANAYQPVSYLTVQAQSKPSILYFTGVTSPLNLFNIVTPVQGIITSVKANYGDHVKKGQLLYLIQSAQMETDYRRTIESFMKAKSAYQSMLFQSTGNVELYRLGLISKVDFMNKQEQLQSSELEMWDADLELQKIFKKTGTVLPADLKNLSLEKIEDVRKFLDKPLAGIQIINPEDGVLLFPSKTLRGGSESKDTEGPVKQGQMVQEGQVLGVVANTTGLVFDINVNEANFHDVHVGQLATITGNAFSPITLSGRVVSINHQASSSDSGDTLYQAKVVVPKLTEKQRQTIQVGMSAQIALTQEVRPSISIPLSAVFLKNKRYWVKVVNPHNQRISDVPVKTGNTGVDTIEITSGLTPGDRVVLSN